MNTNEGRKRKKGENVKQKKRGTPERIFTLAELEAIVSERIKRIRKKYADYEELKAKAKKYDAIERLKTK